MTPDTNPDSAVPPFPPAGRVVAAWTPPPAKTLDLESSLAVPGSPATSSHPFASIRADVPPADADPEPPLNCRLADALQLSLDQLLAPAGPLDWPAGLRPYQREGVNALVSGDALLLADDMGLGKTIQVIAALRALLHRRSAESALLLVPAGLHSNWRRELRVWAPELRLSLISGSPEERSWQWVAPVHVYIVSYDTFRADFTENPFSPPRRRTWDIVILDEAQRIKNRETDLAKKVKRLLRRRAWALTGTPLENRIDDLASILEFVTPLREGQPVARLTEGPELLALHTGLQLRRRKSDVLTQLPPKVVVDVTITLTGAQLRSYQRAEREGVLELGRLGHTLRVRHILELILRLKQICNFCPTTGQSAKLDDLRQRLATLRAEGFKALVFSQFTDERFGVRGIAGALPEFRLLTFTGDMPLPQRDATIARFMSTPDHTALILSTRAGGQGLNLQQASYVFHFDRWWNPAVEHQAEDRAHRMGQRLPVTVYRYTCENTIEERIAAILAEKQALFDLTVDDVSLDLTARLTAAELFGLFGLEPPTAAGAKTHP